MESLATDRRWIEDPRQSLVSFYLSRAMDEFNNNHLSTRLIRRLSEEFPAHFMAAARSYLTSNEPSMAVRYLTTVVLRQEPTFEFLTCPRSASREDAVSLFKRLLDVDPSIDVKLAQRLPNRRESNLSEALDSLHATRAIDILDQTSRGPRLVPMLGHLPASRDSRISAKATLFVGRRVHNPAWVRQQIGHRDPRVRANAIEALWACHSSASVSLLEECARDSHHAANNRVWGNALYGLHLHGRDDVERRVFDMASADEYQFRSTAAWVMGKIATEACLHQLTAMLKDDHPGVRSTALRSLLDLRHTEAGSLLPLAAHADDAPPEPAEPAVPPHPAPHTPAESPAGIPHERHIEVRLDGMAFHVR